MELRFLFFAAASSYKRYRMSKRGQIFEAAISPLDQLNGVEVCSLLGIHRSTLLRLASGGVLIPDGETRGHRKFWLRSSVDAYRLGTMTTATVSHVTSVLLPELSLPVPHGYRILGQGVISIPLEGSTKASALTSLLLVLAEHKTTALALPAHSHTHFIHQTVVDACRQYAIPVILHPGVQQ